MTHGRPPRKPRWQATPDTLVIARHRAAKPEAEHIDTLVHLLQKCFDNLRQGKATELQFSILRGAIDTARMIERQGVVKGLTQTIDQASAALDAIWPRIVKDGSWGTTALYATELADLRDFVSLHIWQIRQLSRAEYLRAVDSARGLIGPSGLVLYGAQAKEAAAS